MKFLMLILTIVGFLTAALTPITLVSALPSDSIVITQLQTGGLGSGTASQEFVLIHNVSSDDINIEGWCVEYSSAANGSDFSKLTCVSSDEDAVELWLQSDGLATFASPQFTDANNGFIPDFMFSAGIAAGGGHVRIVDADKNEIDRVGWGNAVAPEGFPVPAHSSGELLGRNGTDTDDNSADFESSSILDSIESGIYEQEVTVDLCPNVAGIQVIIPDGYYIPEGLVDCELIQLVDDTILITELYPNAPSYDTGLEFIEIHNPNAHTVSLGGYVLQLGPDYTKQFIILAGDMLPHSYVTFSDVDSGIVLPNSSASVRLLSPAGSVVSETAQYNNPTDDVSWALVDESWTFTNRITPSATNQPYQEPAEAFNPQTAGVASVLAPCPAGKFRNPETNRCKTIETATSQLTPCDPDEYRNPETNRCRKTATASSTLTPCKAGQFRNPETNRCKSAATLSSSLVPCKEGQERNLETNRCRKTQDVLGLSSDGGLSKVTDIAVENTAGKFAWPIIALTVTGIFGYVFYEWRSEIVRKVGFLKAKILTR